MVLYLVRHGETTYNAESRVQGHEDPPLTVLGLAQAEAVARRLAREHVDKVYSSDLQRAGRTAEAVAARHGAPVSQTPLLREANLGVIQGRTREEIERDFPQVRHEWRRGALSARPPGAETIQQVIDRCAAFVHALFEEMPRDRGVVIVGHAGSLRGVVVTVLGLPSDVYHKLRFSNASLSIITMNDRCELALLNDTSHLDSLAATDDADSSV